MSSTETAHEGRSARANAERRLGWMLCAPAVTVMLVVTAYPIAYAVWLSLQRYDLRFPELFRAMGEPDIIVLPAAFTAITGQAHWEPLLRARAIENQCFVIASGQGGTHASGRTTHGHSMLIDPWGAILAEQAHGEGMALAELDLRQMASVRTRLPALAHRIF